jgi:hypothetical protein
MDLSRAVYSRDLKIAAMRALDAGSRTGEIARKYQLSPSSVPTLVASAALSYTNRSDNLRLGIKSTSFAMTMGRHVFRTNRFSRR